MATSAMRVTEAVSAQAPPATRTRLFFIDHLRAALVILVVVHHVAMVYGASAPFYYVEPPFADPQAFQTLLIFALFNQAWFMGAFFLLAGYFTPGSVDRKGAGTFLKDRLIRLGIPLLVFIFVLGPIASLGAFLMPTELTGITTSPSFDIYGDLIGQGPLWFVTMLLIFNIGYAIWRALTTGKPVASAESQPGLLWVGLFTLALAVVSFFWRQVVPLGESVGLFEDVLSFPTIAYLPQYLSFFVLGLVASRRGWLRNLSGSMGVVGIVAVVVATVILFPLAFSGKMFMLDVTPALDNAMGNGHWQSAAYVAWDSIFAVGLCLALIPLFRRVFNDQTPYGSFLAKQSYAVYIIHIPIIVYLAYALRGVEAAVLLKTLLAAVIIVPVCYAAAWFIRKIPGFARVV